MPIYEYQCRACGTVSEIFTNVGAHSDALKCAACGGTDLEKMLSATAIITSPASSSGESPCGQQVCCGDSPTCGTACCPR